MFPKVPWGAKRFFLAAALLAVSALPCPSFAQGPASPLATASHLKCTFAVVSTGTWSKDNDAGAEIKKTDLTVEYRSIDVGGGTAEAVGLTGNFFITVRFIVDSLHLLALGDAGPLYVTTVFNRPAHPGTFKAVHTRHEFTDVSMPGFTSRPEQYIGECKIVE
jgi:hypothetical protein